MSGRPRLVVVGAGPAGLAAAVVAAGLGLDVTVVEENSTLGGQYFRGRQTSRLPGSPGWFHRHARAAVRLSTSVFDVSAHDVLSVWSRASGVEYLSFDALVLATGAYDRPVALPGWTLPGVLTAGGAHTLAKAHGVVPGRRILVAGSGPFLFPVADALAEHAARPTVIEATPFSISVRGLRSILRDARLLQETSGYLARLALRGVSRRYSRLITEIHGKDRVEAATVTIVDAEWRPLPGSERLIPVDAVCLGFGFVPQLELPQLAGCRIIYLRDSPDFAVWTDPDMRTSRPGVYAAGEVTGIGGARAAVIKGAIAALAAATDLGVGHPAGRKQRLQRLHARLAHLLTAAEWIRLAFRPRDGLWELASPQTIICRCEDLRLEQLERASAGNAVTPYAIKTATRLGMGLCQGRICSPYLIERLRSASGYSVPIEGRPWVVRPPLRPIPLEDLIGATPPAVRDDLQAPASTGSAR